MIRKVFDALKAESRKGDFVFLTNNDRTELEINISDEEIQNMSKWSFKKLVKERIKFAASSFLVEENRKRGKKTRDIEFEDLKISEYLKENNRTSLSTLIFSIRSKTLDIKYWQPWKYSVNSVNCELYPETIKHFVTYIEYGAPLDTKWTEILENDGKKQTKI